MKTTTNKKTSIRTARVDLSQYHAGQIVEHTAEMRAEGHDYRTGERDAFRRPIIRWRADRWQAVHRLHDRSDGERTETVSSWFGSMPDAEKWLESRGLRLGGAYWHTAREES